MRRDEGHPSRHALRRQRTTASCRRRLSPCRASTSPYPSSHSLRLCAITEAAYHAGAALPVLLDLHHQVQVDVAAEEGLDVAARTHADLTEHLALRTDDDAL